ncbi:MULTISPECIES: hypothetical protein [unclassified Haladaptatus]|uniref:hypothetical protein n=1 Tax=unclassified Haladaptatus TaxID=2622732 RepID=UPI0023E887DF|nr:MULTISPECIES: hypothetical protein [unclassified Haladaptatus]
MTTAGWFYLAGGTLLFFFWAYGIVSFARDLKNRFIPALLALRGQREESDADDQPAQHDDQRQQLY